MSFSIKKHLKNILKLKQPFSSYDYWESRYSTGGNSGSGSYGKLAEFKASILNNFVIDRKIESVIEFGCGDGNQLQLANYPMYTGFDVSNEAIKTCKNKFKNDTSKQFKIMKEYKNEKADLVLSLDVIFHLVEDKIFKSYMQIICSATNRYLIIYSSNDEKTEEKTAVHVKHRKFTDWIDENYSDLQLTMTIPNKYQYDGDYRNTSFSSFYIYKKK